MQQHTPLSNTSLSTAAPSEAPAYNSIKSIKERMNAEDQIERLLSQVWRNPYDVLTLDKEATDEEIRKSFKAHSLLLHPDKCKDPRGPDCFTIIEQSYKTLLDPEKRKVFQKIMREAWERTEYDRQKENKRREKVGQCLIPEDTFDAEYRANTRRIFDEIEDKKAHYLRLAPNFIFRTTPH
jgi:DnaJ family protein C protein 8